MGRPGLDLGAASPSSPPEIHDHDQLVARGGEVHGLDAEALPGLLESLLLAQNSFVALVDVAFGDFLALGPFDLGVHALQPRADSVAVDQLVAGTERVERWPRDPRSRAPRRADGRSAWRSRTTSRAPLRRPGSGALRLQARRGRSRRPGEPCRRAIACRGGADVGQQHAAGRLEQLGGNLGLVLVDVEARGADLAVAQRPRQRPRVDQRPARGVDEDRLGLHRRQLSRADQPGRFGGRRQVEADHVGAAKISSSATRRTPSSRSASSLRVRLA